MDLSLHKWYTQTQTKRHARTHLVVAIHQGRPQCVPFLLVASRCHIERKLGSCWAFGSGPGCPPPPSNSHQNSHTTLAHKCTNAKASNTRTQKVTHTHTQRLASLSFLTGRQRAAGFTPTQLCNPLALSSINLCNMKHKHTHKPTGMQYVWGGEKRIKCYSSGRDRLIFTPNYLLWNVAPSYLCISLFYGCWVSWPMTFKEYLYQIKLNQIKYL